MKKKILTLALSLILCISAVFLFAGCDGDPGHKATLTSSATDILQFNEGESAAARTKIDALTFTYTANGDTHMVWNKDTGKNEEVAYLDWSGTFKEAYDNARGGQDKVRACTYSGLDVTTATTGTSTRTLTIDINNATIRLQYQVIPANPNP